MTLSPRISAVHLSTTSIAGPRTPASQLINYWPGLTSLRTRSSDGAGITGHDSQRHSWVLRDNGFPDDKKQAILKFHHEQLLDGSGYVPGFT